MRQLAGGLVVTEQHVGHAVSLAARQPDHQHGMHAGDDRLNRQGPPGDENNHDSLAGSLRRRDQAHVISGEAQVLAIAGALGVGLFPDHHHDCVGGIRAPHPGRELDFASHRGLLDGPQYRRAGCDVAPPACPTHSPAAALDAHVVRLAAHHQDVAILGQGQHGVLILEQDRALPNGLARQRPVLARAKLAGERGIREGMLPQFQTRLLLQDTADSIVDACHGHATIFDQVAQGGEEPLVGQRHHGHVDAGIDGCLDLAIVRTRQGVDGFPVADYETLEAKFALEHVGDEVLVGVHGGAVPAGERHHD